MFVSKSKVKQRSTIGVLEVSEIFKRYGAKTDAMVLQGISISIQRGELLVLLGPSGCGKTTLLRTIAGLEDATSGAISMFGRKVVDVEEGRNIPTHRRNVGMVFQNYALWPHMTIVDNVAYPLRMRGVSKTSARLSAAEMLEILRCEHLKDRYPAQLSGGQQQRVALGRSLVGQPETVLFDEPLSNIDEQLRGEVRNEIRRLHRELSFTGIYVTHDQREGFEIGDRVAIMEKGRIVQLATPEEIYSSPASAYVARFLGVENTLKPEVRDGMVVCDQQTSGDWGRLVQRAGEGPFELMIRSDDLQVLVDQSEVSEKLCHIFGGVVADVVFRGGTVQLVVKVGEQSLFSTTKTDVGIPSRGDRVVCSFDPDRAFVFPAER